LAQSLNFARGVALCEHRPLVVNCRPLRNVRLHLGLHGSRRAQQLPASIVGTGVGRGPQELLQPVRRRRLRATKKRAGLSRNLRALAQRR